MDKEGMNAIEKGELASNAIQCFRAADGSLSDFPKLLKRVIEEKAWEHRVHHGREYTLKNLRELITKQPMEGWGQDPRKVEAVIRDNAEVLAMWREAMKSQGKADNIRYNINEVGRGTSRQYTLDRLKRENPELFEEVKAGRLSANAAAIKAGWRKKRTPLEVAKSAVLKLSQEDLARLKLWLKEQANP